jgi:hypothetical protein
MLNETKSQLLFNEEKYNDNNKLKLKILEILKNYTQMFLLNM